MRKLAYSLVKIWMKINLHLYFGKIKISGLENVPQSKPVLFLPNHQSALLDVLLIAVDCNRKPWFLTRSDVFKTKTLNSIFDFFQMIPIYRIRDGRESLKNNQAVFDRCSDLLQKNEAILMFPEANHNLKRRVRPLSKGFTRILFNTMDRDFDIDIQIVPVGINYADAVHFPDRVALYFDKPISAKALYDTADVKSSVERIKQVVSNQLKTLTTHIEEETNYDLKIKQLKARGIDFLHPKEANLRLQQLDENISNSPKKEKNSFFRFFKAIFTIVNLPMLLLWRTFCKPKVWEQEFMGTLRFAFSLISYPIYYFLLFFVFSFVFTPLLGLTITIGLFLFNWLYVKTYKI